MLQYRKAFSQFEEISGTLSHHYVHGRHLPVLLDGDIRSGFRSPDRPEGAYLHLSLLRNLDVDLLKSRTRRHRKDRRVRATNSHANSRQLTRQRSPIRGDDAFDPLETSAKD